MILLETGDNLLLETGDSIYEDPSVEYKFIYHETGNGDTTAKVKVWQTSSMASYTRDVLLGTYTYNWSGNKTDAEILDLTKVEAAVYGENVTIQA